MSEGNFDLSQIKKVESSITNLSIEVEEPGIRLLDNEKAYIVSKQ